MLTLCRLLIGLGRAIVPVAFRDDWTREWHAELYHQTAGAASRPLSRAARRNLVIRCAGAVVHAAWLRKEEWSFTVLLQDLRYAIRSLRTRAGFSAVCILILALGIGANAAVFSVLNGVLLKPLPYRAPDRLVQIWETNPAMNWTAATVAPANLLDWRERNQSFVDIAYYLGADGKGANIGDATLTGSGEPERIRAMTVSGNFFDVLGVEPALGRLLRPSDTRDGEPRAVVLSDGFWRRRFGGDPSIVGRRIDINGVSTEVAGVAGRAFHVPGADVDYWEAHRMPDERQRRMRRAHWFRTVARLKAGVSLDQARSDLTRIAAELERQYPNTNTQMGVGLGPFHDWFVGDVRQAMLMLMAAVGVVLLITCTNVASLLLFRATARRREIAIRVALGAGRIRLIRQLLTESFVLASVAGALGLAVAYGCLTLLRRIGPSGIPRLEQVAIEGWVLAFVAATVCATTLLFGLAPAWQSARPAAADALKTGSRGTTADGTGLRRSLIVAEVALSVVLLAGAGLLLRSFVRLQGIDPGIDASQVLSFRIALPGRYDSDPKVAAFFSQTVASLRAIAGVQAAGATGCLPLEGYSWTGDLFIEKQPEVWGRELRHKSVTPGYFAAAGLRVIRGRDFDAGDTASGQMVIVVNHTLARRYYGNADPVATRIAFERPSPTTTWFTIVGVVADEKQDGLDAPVQPEVYAPHAQDARDTMAVVVRTPLTPASLLPAVKSQVAAVDNAIALYDVRTLGEVVDASLAEERFSTLLLGGFALTALLLAGIGLYGIVAFTVTERTREIGVRIALGANRADVLRMVVWSGTRVVLIGVALGLIGAILASRAIESFLFQTPPADPLVLASVATLLILAGLSASYLPAYRASRVDPAVSLRAE
jgi:predicted permease